MDDLQQSQHQLHPIGDDPFGKGETDKQPQGVFWPFCLSKTPLENIYQIPHIQRYEGISISPSPILFYLGLYLFSGPDNGVPD